MHIEKLDSSTKKNLLEDLLKRSPNSYGKYEASVKEILDNVQDRRDEAVFAYTKQFDGADINASNIQVTEEEIKEAYSLVDDSLLAVIRKAKKNIEVYHEKQRQYSWFDSRPDGTILGQKVTALARVGVYVPPSSVLMNIMPAKVAGVEEIIMVTPPGKDGKVTPTTLVAANEAGADKVYKVGGAQAIAALAFGTESIPKVDKIVGPGNIYVALAKKSVYGYVSIDSVAGPSEILVLADDTANPRYVAADLLSQAEHGADSQAILVFIGSRAEAERKKNEVMEEIKRLLNSLGRRGYMEESLALSRIIAFSSIPDAMHAVNEYAPEHLIINTEHPEILLDMVRSAGSVFLGPYSPESAGDYASGTNHTLPTSGFAKSTSGVSVDSFLKKITVQEITKEGALLLSGAVMAMADAEGLSAHKEAMRVRLC